MAGKGGSRQRRIQEKWREEVDPGEGSRKGREEVDPKVLNTNLYNFTISVPAKILCPIKFDQKTNLWASGFF